MAAAKKVSERSGMRRTSKNRLDKWAHLNTKVGRSLGDFFRAHLCSDATACLSPVQAINASMCGSLRVHLLLYVWHVVGVRCSCLCPPLQGCPQNVRSMHNAHTPHIICVCSCACLICVVCWICFGQGYLRKRVPRM
jgi:hypothetical protein